jgi:hypothetical protein
MSETGGAGRLAPARAAGVSPITFRKLGGSANDASTAATRRGQKLAPAHLDRHMGLPERRNCAQMTVSTSRGT